MSLERIADHLSAYERDGYTIVRGAYTAAECDDFVQYMLTCMPATTRSKASAPAILTIGTG